MTPVRYRRPITAESWDGLGPQLQPDEWFRTSSVEGCADLCSINDHDGTSDEMPLEPLSRDDDAVRVPSLVLPAKTHPSMPGLGSAAAALYRDRDATDRLGQASLYKHIKGKHRFPSRSALLRRTNVDCSVLSRWIGERL